MTDSIDDSEEAEDIITLVIPGGEGGRLDKVLAGLVPDISRARLQALIGEGAVHVNDALPPGSSFKVKPDDAVTIIVPPPVAADPQPEAIPLDIRHEDDDLLVINKAAGMVVHPGAGNGSGTLVNALLHHCKDTLSGIGGVMRPGIVHRLDKDTSGLLIVAKNDTAHRGLSAQLADRTLSRRYQAFVWKVPRVVKGTIDLPIGRHPAHRLKMAVRPKGAAGAREAVTHYLCEESWEPALALLRCDLQTGRTHQIRVHMLHAGHPLVGDPLYGLPRQEQEALLRKAGANEETASDITGFSRQALHAAEIRFTHPRSGADMAFSCPLPDDLQQLYNSIKSIS